jgi:hypothetical protein
MEQRHASLPAQQIEILKQMSVRARAGQTEDPIKVAETQERGFGMLMSMEAQLQDIRRRARAANRAGAPPDPPEAQDLLASIAALRDALTELRGLAGDDQSKIGYGFVLPDCGTPPARGSDSLRSRR